MKVKTHNYTALFQKEPEGGYTVTVPVLPGCVTYGKDIKEAKKMAEEAIIIYLESLKAHNEAIPTEENVMYKQIPVSLSSYA